MDYLELQTGGETFHNYFSENLKPYKLTYCKGFAQSIAMQQLDKHPVTEYATTGGNSYVKMDKPQQQKETVFYGVCTEQ
jgi:hypothetical protein